MNNKHYCLIKFSILQETTKKPLSQFEPENLKIYATFRTEA